MPQKDNSILMLCLVVLVTTMGAGIVAPLLPGYATRLGANSVQVGSIFASFSFSRSIFVPLFGRLSDMWGRMPFILSGLFLYALVSFLYLLGKEVGHLVLIRFGQGLASAMVLPVAIALAADISKEKRLGRTMGLLNTSMYLGLSFGPIMGGILEERYGMPSVFMTMGAFALVAFFICAAIPWPPLTRADFKGSYHKSSFALLKSRDMAITFIFRLTYTMAIGILWAFLPLYAQREVGLPSSKVGLVVTINVFVAGCLQVPMGTLSDRIKRGYLIVLGGLLSVIGLWGLKRAHSFWELFGYNALIGTGGGISMPALMAMVAEEGRRHSASGFAMGINTFSHSFGMLIGPLLGGLILDLYGFGGIFFFSMVLNLFGISVIVLALKGDMYKG
ncbi:MAG: MFS transporter [Desulfatiglandales bacterium]